MAPLTPEQAELAATCVRFAYHLARRLAARLPAAARDPGLADELEGAAVEGVCRAAATFDPARGVRFTTHAAWSARGEMSRVLAAHGREKRGWGRTLPLDRPVPAPPAADPDDGPHPHAGVGALAFSLLTEREAEAVRLRFWDGLTYRAAGDRMGVTPARVGQLERKGLAKLRKNPRMAAYA